MNTSATLAIFGGLVSLPAIMTEFPVNVILLVPPLSLCLAIPKLHRSDPAAPGRQQRHLMSFEELRIAGGGGDRRIHLLKEFSPPGERTCVDTGEFLAIS